MSTHPGMLLAYDAAGDVIATLDFAVIYDDSPDRVPLGLVDFIGHEEAEGDNLDIWNVSDAAGSKAWPEYLGSRAHDFRVELDGPPGKKHIKALVHKKSGVRRERETIEREISGRIAAANGGPADIRDLVGGPERPIRLDDAGNRAAPVKRRKNKLPIAKVT